MPRKTPLPLIPKIRITNLKNLRMLEGNITGNALRPDFREVKKNYHESLPLAKPRLRKGGPTQLRQPKGLLNHAAVLRRLLPTT
jgi:hypothetical protein